MFFSPSNSIMRVRHLDPLEQQATGSKVRAISWTVFACESSGACLPGWCCGWCMRDRLGPVSLATHCVCLPTIPPKHAHIVSIGLSDLGSVECSSGFELSMACFAHTQAEHCRIQSGHKQGWVFSLATPPQRIPSRNEMLRECQTHVTKAFVQKPCYPSLRVEHDVRGSPDIVASVLRPLFRPFVQLGNPDTSKQASMAANSSTSVALAACVSTSALAACDWGISQILRWSLRMRPNVPRNACCGTTMAFGVKSFKPHMTFRPLVMVPWYPTTLLWEPSRLWFKKHGSLGTRTATCSLRQDRQGLHTYIHTYVHTDVAWNRGLSRSPRTPFLQTFAAGPLLQTLVAGLCVEYCSLQ